MTRKKVKLAYISNDSARKATFKKRKKGLMKKVSELSTLCGIEACAIIYSPYESQAEVWPSAVGVQRVLSEFKQLPEMEQSKKMVNQESFLRQRIAKANEQLKRQCKDNREKEMTQVMFQTLISSTNTSTSTTGKAAAAGGNLLHDLNMMDLNDLGWLIDQTLKDIHKRVDSLNKKAATDRCYSQYTTTNNNNNNNNNSQLIISQSQAQAAGTSASAAEAMGKMISSHGDHQGKLQLQAAVQAADHQDHHQHQGSMDTTVHIRQQWVMDQLMMNPSFGGGDDDDITMQQLPFGDNNHHNQTALWPSSSNAFFP